MLWAEMSEDSARHNLRHELWRLRKAICLAANQSPPSTCTPKNSPLALTRTRNIGADVAQLTRDEPGAQPANSSPNSGYTAASSCPGFYDDWVMFERERVQAVFERKMQQLLERLVR